MPIAQAQRLGKDPGTKFSYHIEIDGIQSTSFLTCEGLNKSTAVVESRHGGDPLRMFKQAGRETIGDITLSYGFSQGREDLYDWSVSKDRRSFSIVQTHTNGDEIARWNIFEAWPRELSLDTWDSESESDKQVQTIIIVCEDWEQVAAAAPAEMET